MEHSYDAMDAAREDNSETSIEQQNTHAETHDAPAASTVVPSLSWGATDATHLLAANIPLARAPRAWDRKPQSPYSRKRLKVGKVWKRANVPSIAVPSTYGSKRRVSLSPSKKATKKIRLGEGAAVGVEVGWEGLGAPERRIVTRASRLAELSAAPLVELADDGAAEELGKSNGSNSLVDVDLSEEGASDAVAGGWEDVDLNLGKEELEEATTTGEEVLEVTERPKSLEHDIEELETEDSTLDVDQTHLDDEGDGQTHQLHRMTARSGVPETSRPDTLDHEADLSTISVDERIVPGAINALSESESQQTIGTQIPPAEECDEIEAGPATSLAETSAESAKFSFAAAAQIPVLPAGFVSPVKDRRRRPIREARQSMASRRRTLPVNFTAFESFPVIAVPSVESQIVEKTTSQPDRQDELPSGPSDTVAVYVDMAMANDDEHESDEWEDVPDAMDEEIPSDVRSSEVEPIETTQLTIAENVYEEADETNLATTPTLLYNEHVVQGKKGDTDLAELPHASSDGSDHEIEQPSDTPATTAASNEPPSSVEDEQLIESRDIQQDAMAADALQNELDTSEHEVNDEQIMQPHLASSTQDTSAKLTARQASRRQSSSPRKSRTTNSAHRDLPHLVAFTPMKIRGPSVPFGSAILQPEIEVAAIQSVELADEALISPRCSKTFDLSNVDSMVVDAEIEPLSTTRSVSAPPEPVQTSPRKARQPRISDDTALLQAFLSRAAESKSKAERRMSASKRESLENRRDSDTIRFALATSPVVPQYQEKEPETEVLRNLDPNSPSPRKQQAIIDKAVKSEQPEAIPQPTSTAEAAETVPSADIVPESRSKRRSTRPRKQPQVLDTSERTAISEESTTNAGPNKISIRPFGSDPVVWKRPEAQEIALLTRTNTRKNKGALNPQQRLTKLAAEEAGLVQIEGTDIVLPAAELQKIKAKSVRWAETLAMFQAGPVLVEDSGTTDAQEPAQSAALLDSAALDEVVNKPQIKKLKPRLTPRAPVYTESIDELEAGSDVIRGQPTFQLPDLPPATPAAEHEVTKLKRRTRLATPAKIKGGKATAASVSSEQVDTPDAGAQPAIKTGENKNIPIPAPKRSLISKLPAPVSSSSAIGTLAHPVRDRETTSLIASPPKKKLRGMRSSTRQQQQQQPAPSLDLAPTTTTSTSLKPPSSLSFGFSGSNVPKFEATSSKTTSLAAPSSDLTLSLVSSPAKKAPRLFPMAMSGSSASTHRELDAMKAMGSPAKKRGRPPRA
jgi:hypothetical protein